MGPKVGIGGYVPTWSDTLTVSERSNAVKQAYKRLTRREQDWVEAVCETMDDHGFDLEWTAKLELIAALGLFLNVAADNGGDRVTLALLTPPRN